MKKIVLNIKEDSVAPIIEGDINYSEAIQVMLSGLYGICENGMKQIAIEAELKPAEKQELREDVYDMLNIAFGNILEKIIPSEDIPDLTTEAILAAETKIINDAYKTGKTLDETLRELKDGRTVKN